MPRLFFAIRTSEEQRTELLRVQRELLGELNDLGANYKLENIDNSHCTLRFLGNVESSAVKQLIESTQREIDNAAATPFELTLDQCDTFSNRGKAKVIWCGLSNAPELVTLRKIIDRALAETNIETEPTDEFHPHLTLIRFREPFRLPADFQLPDVASVASKIAEVELVESKTLPTGALHQVIARFGL